MKILLTLIVTLIATCSMQAENPSDRAAKLRYREEVCQYEERCQEFCPNYKPLTSKCYLCVGEGYKVLSENECNTFRAWFAYQGYKLYDQCLKNIPGCSKAFDYVFSFWYENIRGKAVPEIQEGDDPICKYSQKCYRYGYCPARGKGPLPVPANNPVCE